ncbi:dihydrolipoyl dehydrogenase family protein [Phreatobacter sp.]|uniref:dihydrolipoyl dehydrogenase family protein n=1 Tax=Phreatobacter sp. TaxID=1966341 RepID=UPI003F6F6ABD
MDEKLTPDVCVIGAGSGGLTVAAFCAMLGAPVVLVERGLMGGDCLNAGCVPSKALIAAARAADMVHEAPAFGIGSGRSKVNVEHVREHIRETIATIAPNDSEARFAALGVRVIRGEAAFRDPSTVEVGTTTIAARRFVIATGSRPFIPAIPGLDGVPYLTNESVFELGELPRHLAVIGAGPVGLEIAQSWRRLGAEVTVLERDRMLASEDPEMVRPVRDALVEDGIALHEGAEVFRVEGEAGALRLHVRRGEEEGLLEASHLLVAVGRQPALDALALDKAGITHSARGVTVDRGLRTTNRRVYAIGDASGAPQFTHVAGWHGSLVAQNILFRRPVRTDRTPVPRVVFTDPELAHVGQTEAEARASDARTRVLRWPFSENDRAVAMRRTRGHVKLVIGRKGRLLGCTITGHEAGELIAPFVLAVSKSMTVQDLAGMVLPYPTLAEIGKRAAGTYFQSSIGNPWIGRIVRLLRRFG